MKELSQTLLNGQIAKNRIPAVKVQIQGYTFPAQSPSISMGSLSWQDTENLTIYAPVQAASPSDGSLVILDADLEMGKQRILSVNNGALEAIKVTNGGSGYTYEPNVSVTGGGGSGYDIRCQVSGGKVTAVFVIDGGENFTSVPTIGFGGDGADAAAEVGDPSPTADFYRPTLETFRILYSEFTNYSSSGKIEVRISQVGSVIKFQWRCRESAAGTNDWWWSEWSNDIVASSTPIRLKAGGTTGIYPINEVRYLVISDICFPPVSASDNPSDIQALYYVGQTWTWGMFKKPIDDALNDITVSGTPTSFAGIKYMFTITSVGTPDKFKWLKEGDNIASPTEGKLSAEIECSTDPVLIEDGIYAQFTNTTGHLINSYWVSTVMSKYSTYKIRRYTDSGADPYTPTWGADTPVAITVNGNQSAIGGYMEKVNTEWKHVGRAGKYDTTAIAANSNSAEVIIAAWHTTAGVNYLQVKSSSDCGATWGAWADIYHNDTYPTIEGNIAIGMNDDGDVGIWSNLGFHIESGIELDGAITLTRINGTWTTGIVLTVNTTSKQLSYDGTSGWYLFGTKQLNTFSGQTLIVDSTPATLSLLELQTLLMPQEDLHYIPRPDWARWRRTRSLEKRKVVQTYMQKIDTSITLPTEGWFVIRDSGGKNYVILLKDYYVYILQRDGIQKVVQIDSYYYNTTRNCILAQSGTYLFQIRDHTIYSAIFSTGWSVPTIGAGAGSSLDILKAKIRSIEEEKNPDQPSTLDITFNNSDDYFDSPGAGALAVLAIGSRINLFLGYTIATVDTFEEYARYFVDDWGYTRAPNLSEFAIHCVDAWGLLQKYKFPKPINYNKPHEKGIVNNEITTYEIIEKLVNAIGGTLSYISRSAFITNFYPVVAINTGDIASSVLSRLLNMVPDEIRFFGNDGYIVYPQTTDSSTYLYKFPVI